MKSLGCCPDWFLPVWLCCPRICRGCFQGRPYLFPFSIRVQNRLKNEDKDGFLPLVLLCYSHLHFEHISLSDCVCRYIFGIYSGAADPSRQLPTQYLRENHLRGKTFAQKIFLSLRKFLLPTQSKIRSAAPGYIIYPPTNYICTYYSQNEKDFYQIETREHKNFYTMHKNSCFLWHLCKNFSLYIESLTWKGDFAYVSLVSYMKKRQQTNFSC